MILYASTLVLLGWQLNSLMVGQKQKNDEKKSAILKCKNISSSVNYYNLLKTKLGNSTTDVVLEQVIISQNLDTFLFNQRQQPLNAKMQNVYPCQSGGKFEFKNNDVKGIGQINETSMFSSIFECKEKHIALFHKMKPVAKSIICKIKNSISFAMVGKLSYDTSSEQFKLELTDMAQTLSQILDHYTVGSQYYTLRVCSYALMVLGALLLGLQIIQLINYYKVKQKYHRCQTYITNNPNKTIVQLYLAYFRDGKVDIKSDSKRPLNCYHCRGLADMVYSCGHLSSCENCFNNQSQKKCLRCQKNAQPYIKIYLS